MYRVGVLCHAGVVRRGRWSYLAVCGRWRRERAAAVVGSVAELLIVREGVLLLPFWRWWRRSGT